MAEPYRSEVIPFGRGTLDLQRPVGEVAPENYALILNVLRRQDGQLTGRVGLTRLLLNLAGEGQITSLARLNERPEILNGIASDPLGLKPTGVRFIGTLSGKLFYAPSGVAFPVLGATDQLFSGATFSTIAYRPPLAARAWLYIGDAARMAKIKPVDAQTALLLPLGLPAPGNPDARMPMDEFPPELYFGGWTGTLTLRNIANFTLVGYEAVAGATAELAVLAAANNTFIDPGEDATPWTANAGTGGVPTVAIDTVVFKVGTASLKFSSNAGAAVTAYYNFFNRALSLNLNRVGNKEATDEDHIHGWVRVSDPSKVSELRVYFILSHYDAAVLPGIATDKNDNFYAKAFRPDEFAEFLRVQASALEAQATQNQNTETQQSGGGVESPAGVPALAAGQATWTEFGALKLPLRRGDFSRYGTDETLNWKNVVGLSVCIVTEDNSAVDVWLDDLRLTGGAGPDSSLPGNQPYNWRYRNYDPRTGVKGNPCDISLDEFFLSPVRQSVTLHPQPYGASEIVQQFFRQGGVLTRAWYFVGQNAQDGQSLNDNKTDAQIINAEILEDDNDQPVTTVDEHNHTVLAQPLHTIFGPADDTIFGIGDPYRRGDVYWCKRGDADAWPRYQHKELCGSSEDLVAGYLIASQPFCMSRERGFALFPNMAGDGQMGAVPTGCMRGPISRTAYAVGQGGCFFLGKDGFYFTTGGEEVSLSNDWIKPLFYGEAVNGLFPIDYQQPDAVRVQCHGTDIWLVYKDTLGTTRCLIFDYNLKYWRPYLFRREGPYALLSEPAYPLTLLVGSLDQVYQHAGTTDDGLAIPGFCRSGARRLGDSRDTKLLGDLWLQLDRQGVELTATALLDDETISLPSLPINTGSGMSEYILDIFDSVGSFGSPGPRQARNLSLQLNWSSSDGQPLLREWAPSFIDQPTITKGRPTDWDNQGRLTDKMVKGIMIEADTGGVDKEIVIEADGVVQQTFTINHAGRLSKHYTWAEFEGRVLRVNPSDSVEWQLYDYRWIFDEEPAQLERWETQLVDHGYTGWQSIPMGYITYRAETPVTLEIDVYNQEGQVIQTIQPTPALDASPVKRKLFCGFPAHKGCFFKYRFVGTSTISGGPKFWLYKPETSMFIQPWDGSAPRWVRPFGDDDLDLVRGLKDAGLGAARSGGGGQ